MPAKQLQEARHQLKPQHCGEGCSSGGRGGYLVIAQWRFNLSLLQPAYQLSWDKIVTPPSLMHLLECEC